MRINFYPLDSLVKRLRRSISCLARAALPCSEAQPGIEVREADCLAERMDSDEPRGVEGLTKAEDADVRPCAGGPTERADADEPLRVDCSVVRAIADELDTRDGSAPPTLNAPPLAKQYDRPSMYSSELPPRPGEVVNCWLRESDA
mmetsp:Transcript_8461/g.21766  ORF Transcript_8461/g.21766 Transcript_8461/m.21766 type:complete len:146 (+) Transcript_8461:58-495(+)